MKADLILVVFIAEFTVALHKCVSIRRGPLPTLVLVLRGEMVQPCLPSTP